MRKTTSIQKAIEQGLITKEAGERLLAQLPKEAQETEMEKALAFAQQVFPNGERSPSSIPRKVQEYKMQEALSPVEPSGDRVPPVSSPTLTETRGEEKKPETTTRPAPPTQPIIVYDQSANWRIIAAVLSGIAAAIAIIKSLI